MISILLITWLFLVTQIGGEVKYLYNFSITNFSLILICKKLSGKNWPN